MYATFDENHNLVPTNDINLVEEWFKHPEWRRVGLTLLNRRRGIWVSTVFLVIEHGWREKMWFETMIFGTSIDGYCVRYATWDEAVKGHGQSVHRARQARWVKGIKDWNPN